jgi:hypothetical protein
MRKDQWEEDEKGSRIGKKSICKRTGRINWKRTGRIKLE